MFLLNDKLVKRDQVAISPDDRGYFFGDGVYEVFRIYNGGIFEKEAHYKRLVRSAGEVKIPLPFSIEKIDGLLEDLLAAEQIQEGIIYLQITRGIAPRNHGFPPAGTTPVLTAYCKEVKRPLGQLQEGLRAVTVPDIRWLRCDIKTLNLLPNILAKQEAVDRGADEAILHRNGTVTECSSSNIMIVKDGVIFTHPATNLILHGVTRGVVLRLAARNGLEVREEPFDLDTLYAADEVFITGTTAEVTPIVEIDGKPAGNVSGPVTRTLQKAFEQLIHETTAG